jgi:hypothetical protein
MFIYLSLYNYIIKIKQFVRYNLEEKIIDKCHQLNVDKKIKCLMKSGLKNIVIMINVCD